MKKILVIFLCACLLCLAIYKYNISSKKNILFLGDTYLINQNFKTYDEFLYENRHSKINIYDKLFLEENKSYVDIMDDIKNNYYIVNKNKKIYLNQSISNADFIIINASNKAYFEKCKKLNIDFFDYNKKNNKNINNLRQLISKISKAKIIFIGNYCKDSNVKYDISSDINLNINRTINSFDSYNIYNQIVNIIDNT